MRVCFNAAWEPLGWDQTWECPRSLRQWALVFQGLLAQSDLGRALQIPTRQDSDLRWQATSFLSLSCFSEWSSLWYQLVGRGRCGTACVITASVPSLAQSGWVAAAEAVPTTVILGLSVMIKAMVDVIGKGALAV